MNSAAGAAFAASARVACDGSNHPNGVTICAGLSGDNRNAAILLSNFDSTQGSLELSLLHLPAGESVLAETFVVDAEHDLELIACEQFNTADIRMQTECPTHSIRLIRIRCDQG